MHHAFENVTVLLQEEILGAQDLHGGVQCVVIEQDSAQDTSLGFNVVRKRSFQRGVVGHFGFRLIFAQESAVRKSSFSGASRARRLLQNFAMSLGRARVCPQRARASTGLACGEFLNGGNRQQALADSSRFGSRRTHRRDAQASVPAHRNTTGGYSSFLTASFTVAVTSR